MVQAMTLDGPIVPKKADHFEAVMASNDPTPICE